MTIQQCYEQLGVSYAKVFKRIPNEAMIKRFALKFPEDPSFEQLKEALSSGDVKTAFRAVHTLKGVSVNLGFDNLYVVASKLTELLRNGQLDGSEELFKQVSEEYNKTVKFLLKVNE